MKKQILIVALMVLGATQTFAAQKDVCAGKPGDDISVQIECYETATKNLASLNNQRMQNLANDPALRAQDLSSYIAPVMALRAATEARKKIFCSLQNAGSPFGGRGAALSNRECFLEQEQQLTKELFQIRAIAKKTVQDIKSW